MAQKPSIPKGTRDFNPEQVAKRNYIFQTIKKVFETFGFQPIETPSFENSETLMGKYGDEGDRLIFKILNSGDYFKDIRRQKVKTVLNSDRFSKFFNDFLNSEILSFSEKLEVLLLKYYPNEKRRLEIKSFMELEEDEFEILKNEYDGEKLLRTYILKYNNYFFFDSEKDTKDLSEKALRYDLTVPFARYVVQHQNEIEFPFKRYQMQPVWRADRPQKGRFREFYQCDADVVGSTSLWQEVEFVQLYDTVFSALKLEGVTIKINNRKILSGIAEVIGAQDKLIDFTVALDKLDKIGEEKVKEEMLSKNIPQSGIDKLQPLFSLTGTFESQIESLKTILASSEEGVKGIQELEFIKSAITTLGLQTATLQLDVTLARGLNYYTGAIFEVSAPENVQMGSIGGGGRYDDLTGIFGLKDVSGVGISFGLDRIYLVLEELNLFPETITKTIEVLFINFGDKEALFSLKAIKKLRESGINAELYPDAAKMKKQMNHANKRNIPFVVLVGEEEITSNSYTLKNMISGEQQKLTLEELVSVIK
ncbi:histidine--tRNA ligase [Yeosuana marina]|uniref:histidine--tRNA ligase n=1 Tax=Yeosuana marina TaxID=1565536 RepID=UPI0030EC8FF8|tara:strand:- start:7282 stop:8889 length:1608 start_codon:yes stop_codon:yes gene_type:complete